MGGQDEEHPEAVADPCERVQEVYTPAFNYLNYFIKLNEWLSGIHLTDCIK